MTINLEDYAACLGKAAPELAGTLEATFHDAARVMSPAGLHDYMEGARALCGLGRGHDLVLSYLEVAASGAATTSCCLTSRRCRPSSRSAART